MPNYLEETRYFGPSNNVCSAVGILNRYERGALDLGCGSFRHSKYLFNCGFIVDAIDKDSEVEKYTDFFKHRPKDLFTLTISDYKLIDFGVQKYDIVVAQNTLSFNVEDEVSSLLMKIGIALKNGGVFAGNLYGLRDFRYGSKNMSFYNESSAKGLLSRIGNIKAFVESENKNEGEDKNLHSFEFVVEK